MYAVNRITGSPSAMTIERAGKHPVGQSDADDRRLGDDRDDDERHRVDAQRSREHAASAEQDRRHRGVRRALLVTVSSARDDLRALCGRASGSFARHASPARRARAGTSGRSSAIWLRRLAHVRARAASAACAVERRLPGEQLVRHAAERVDVGAMIDRRIARRLLGRHVRRRADRRAELRERRRPARRCAPR